jgi:hypothetical protein
LIFILPNSYGKRHDTLLFSERGEQTYPVEKKKKVKNKKEEKRKEYF